MIIGGVAVIAHGVPRLTRDIDATIARSGNDIDAIVAVMEACQVVPRIDDAKGFAEETAVLLLRHAPSDVEIDLSLASLAFEHEALRAAVTHSVAGIKVRLAQPDDLVIYKAAAWRPQDQQDVERLVALHRGTMNLPRVRRLVTEICNVLDEPDRARQIIKLLDRE